MVGVDCITPPRELRRIDGGEFVGVCAEFVADVWSVGRGGCIVVCSVTVGDCDVRWAVFVSNSNLAVLSGSLTSEYRSLSSSSNGEFEKFGCRADFGGVSAGANFSASDDVSSDVLSGGSGSSAQSSPAKLSSRHPISSSVVDAKSSISGSVKKSENLLISGSSFVAVVTFAGPGVSIFLFSLTLGLLEGLMFRF